MDFVQSIDQVTIVGTGLLGGSLGLALKKRGHRAKRVGVGRRDETLARAKAKGCIDAGTLDLPEALRPHDGDGVNLVVVATALGTFPAIFREIAQHDHDRLIVTDVGSVKGFVVDAAREAGLCMERFAGSHPMAGSEQQGPAAARADLFEGKPCVVTFEDDSESAQSAPGAPKDDAPMEGAAALVADCWRFVGMRLLFMRASEHDAQVAVASHLPHALASIMIQLACEHGALDVASTGFADTTRVASGDAAIWADIFSTNRQAMLDALDFCQDALGDLRERVDRDDWQANHDWLEQMRRQRDNWLGRRAGSGGDEQ